jgi:excisionase family DNA binding protein
MTTHRYTRISRTHHREPAPATGRTPSMSPSDGQTVRLLLTVEEAAEQLGIGRTLMYALVKDGAVESVHIGRLRRIPADALPRYLQGLRAALPTLDDSAA